MGTRGFDSLVNIKLRVVVSFHVKNGKNINGEKELALAA